MTAPATVPTIGTATTIARSTRGGSGHQGCCRSTVRNITQPTATPTPYPIAAVMPLTMPWKSQPRGSSDGVRDQQKNRAPNAIPVTSRRRSPHAHTTAGCFRTVCVAVAST